MIIKQGKQSFTNDNGVDDPKPHGSGVSNQSVYHPDV